MNDEPERRGEMAPSTSGRPRDGRRASGDDHGDQAAFPQHNNDWSNTKTIMSGAGGLFFCFKL